MNVKRFQDKIRTNTIASTLAEVLVAMVVLTIVVLAVLGILIQSSYLEQNDVKQTEILALAQGLLESRVDDARVLEGFQDLESIALTPCINPDYLYEQLVSDMPLGMKRISVTIFFADPNNPTQPDPSLSRGGHALTLSVAIAEPTT
jgi:type II secretory pathway pseudopilin PulG